jgi:hypothetical protein
VKNRLLSVLKFGRVRHAFAVMVPVGVVIMAATTALAYYGATGTGTITGVSGATSTTSTVTMNQVVSPAVIAPGGSYALNVTGVCTAGCPAFVSTINLSTWSSDKAGCSEAAMPGSFTMPTILANQSVTTTAGLIGSGTITWNNLSVDQSPCKGANFTFTIVTP